MRFQQSECGRVANLTDATRRRPPHDVQERSRDRPFFAYLRTQFPVITVHEGTMLSYLGMMFNFREEKGALFVTMQNTVDDVLVGCGVDKREH